MFVDSTAALRGVLNSVGDKFEVGTAFYPKVNASDKGGVAVGGSALYVMDREIRPKSTQHGIISSTARLRKHS